MLGLGLSLTDIPVLRSGGGGAPPITFLAANPGEPTEVIVGNASGAHLYDAGSEVHFIEGKGSPILLRINVSDDGLDYYELASYGGDAGVSVSKNVGGSTVGVVINYTGGASITSGTLRRLSIDSLGVVRVWLDGVVFATSAPVSDPRDKNVGLGATTNANSVKYGGDLDLLTVSDSSYNATTGTADLGLLYYADGDVYVTVEINGDDATATYVSNAAPGVAVIRVDIPPELKGSAPEFTITTHLVSDDSEVATEAYEGLYIPTEQLLGANFADVAPGWNSNAVSNKALGGEWQSTSDYGYAYKHLTDPTYIGRNFYPLQMPPTGEWFHKLMQPGNTSTRFRVEFNATDVTFTVSADVCTALGAQQTGGGKKWQDFLYTATDLTNGNPSVTVHSLGSSTSMNAYAIDISGNPINAGYWDDEFVAEYGDPNKWAGGWRNMDFVRANANVDEFDWTDRQTGDDFLAALDGYMPISRQIELMVLLQKPVHWVIPWGATNDYINGFCDELLADIGSLVAIIEVGNEVWNSGFSVWAKALAEGIANDVRMPNGSVPTGDHDFVLCRYAQRVAEVMTLVTAKFTTAGKMSQLIRFVGLQPVPGNVDTVMENYGVDALSDAMGTSLYYGYAAGADPTVTDDLDVIFDRLENDPADGIIAVWETAVLMKAIANTKGKRCISYEIGQEALINDTVRLAMSEDVRCKTMMVLHLQNHKDHWGDIAYVYQDFRAGGDYGFRANPWQSRGAGRRYDAALTAMGL